MGSDGTVIYPGTYAQTVVASQNGYDIYNGQSLKIYDWTGVFFHWQAQIYNSAFYAETSPFNEALSPMQTLSFTIEHEFGHIFAGCSGGNPVGEACADSYARKKLGY